MKQRTQFVELRLVAEQAIASAAELTSSSGLVARGSESGFGFGFSGRSFVSIPGSTSSSWCASNTGFCGRLWVEIAAYRVDSKDSATEASSDGLRLMFADGELCGIVAVDSADNLGEATAVL